MQITPNKAPIKNYTCYITTHLRGYNCLFTVQAANIRQARAIALPQMQAQIQAMLQGATRKAWYAHLAKKYTLANMHLTTKPIIF